VRGEAERNAQDAGEDVGAGGRVVAPGPVHVARAPLLHPSGKRQGLREEGDGLEQETGTGRVSCQNPAERAESTQGPPEEIVSNRRPYLQAPEVGKAADLHSTVRVPAIPSRKLEEVPRGVEIDLKSTGHQGSELPLHEGLGDGRVGGEEVGNPARL